MGAGEVRPVYRVKPQRICIADRAAAVCYAAENIERAALVARRFGKRRSVEGRYESASGGVGA